MDLFNGIKAVRHYNRPETDLLVDAPSVPKSFSRTMEPKFIGTLIRHNADGEEQRSLA